MYATARNRWEELGRNARRSLRTNWSLFRKSKIGLAGLIVILAFVFMAAAAPLLTPYDPNKLAPSVDILRTDVSNVPLEAGRGWSAPVGITFGGPLTQVVTYNGNGTGVAVKVTTGAKGKVVGLVVQSTENITLPLGISLMKYEPYDNLSYLVLAGDRIDMLRADFRTIWSFSMGFQPLYRSDTWNSDQPGAKGTLLMATANATRLWLYAMAPRNPVFNPNAPKVFTHPAIIIPEGIVGDPTVIFLPQANLTEVIVPTRSGVTAYNITLVQEKGILGTNVKDIALGARLWNATMRDGESFSPLPGHTLTLLATNALVDLGKDKVAVVTSLGDVLAFHTRNGTLAWKSSPSVSLGGSFTPTGLYSAASKDTLALTGLRGKKGILTVLDPSTGRVGGKGQQYYVFPVPTSGTPTWIQGGLRWFVTTASGEFYVLDENLKLNATYRPPGVQGTPGVYLGNIFQTGQTQTGNYYGTVLKDSQLVMLLLPGQNIAPLPPGTYLSGNRYLLGTDEAGHDLWTWLVYGSQSELLLGVTASLFAVGLGTLVGLVAGYRGGVVDTLLMRLVDIFLALPGLVLILLLIVVLGPSIFNVVLIVGILSWAPISRVIRSVTLSLKNRAFVEAARVAGASDFRIVFRHVAPNVLPLTFLYMSITVSSAIILEALLAFLGFGDVSHITWGMSLQFLEISGHVLDAPWWLLPPGFAIFLLSLSFYLVGRAMDEIVNPKLRAR